MRSVRAERPHWGAATGPLSLMLARPRLRPARFGWVKWPRSQRDRNLLRVKSLGTSSRTAGSGCFFDLCMHEQLVWEFDNFTGSSVPLIESLKSKAHLITDVRKRKI